jgi:16S rRNA (guanine(966)-N(2))-methyltransferase RsmD
VIAGSAKGRMLRPPRTSATRPITDRAKESLFNILAPRIPGQRFLDLFAGTGGVGIEALSRGAAHVTLVDQDRRACALIRQNLERCGIADGYAIIQTTVLKAIERLRSEPAFDVILLDPPYATDIQDALEHVGEIVKPDGIVVLEHARKSESPVAPGRLVRTREMRSGDSALTFYSCQP